MMGQLRSVAPVLLVFATLFLTNAAAGDPTAPESPPSEITEVIDLPAVGQYGMMTYMHEGDQYIVVQTGGRTPGALVTNVAPSSSRRPLPLLPVRHGRGLRRRPEAPY